MKKILTAFLLILCIIPTSFADTDPDTTNAAQSIQTGSTKSDEEHFNAIKGTVTDSDGDPLVNAYVGPEDISLANVDANKGLINVAFVDSSGNFTLPSFPKNTKMKISLAGYKDKIIEPEKIEPEMNITLGLEELKGAVIPGCSKDQHPHAKDVKFNEEIDACIPTKCIDGYTLEKEDTENAQCIFKEDTPCDISGIDNSLSRGVYVLLSDKSAICQPKCYENYVPRLKNNTYTCKKNSPDCSAKIKRDIISNVPNATDFEAVSWDTTTGQIDKCKITKCSDGFVPNKDGTSCINTKCGCGQEWDSVEEKCKEMTNRTCVSGDTNATEFKYMCRKANGSYVETCNIGDACTQFCQIITCDKNNGYTVDTTNNKCVCDENHTEKGGKCEVKMLLSEKEHKEQIEDLTKNADAMREKETSLASRITDAVGIGGTGIGGAMVGAALSERAADSDAESAMRGYLNSFRCEYGNGQSITYGDTGIELPGGNDMVGLYTQYVQLANDLKIRKESLGLRPGIESEVVLDKANMGLYDDTSVGITGGTYASISRALTNPNGDDATRLAEQRESTNKNLTTGAIVAGGSAIASGVSNIVNNSKNPDRSKEIIKEYDAKRKPATSSGTK